MRQTDTVTADIIGRLAASLGVPAGDTLPVLWHWLLFLDPVPAAELGPDGHRARGGLIPHDPDLPARMWAGGRERSHRRVPVGTRLRRQSRVADVSERAGRSGRLRFVTVQHEIFSESDLVIEERQDIVFRAADAPRPVASPAAPPPPGARLRGVTPDEVLLFRFSALTFNAHRIHYDLPYATMVEHYPGLVVHGPLQAILLAGHLGEILPEGAVIAVFDYRGRAPAFANRPLQLEAWQAADDLAVWHLQTRDPSGAVCMTALAGTERIAA